MKLIQITTILVTLGWAGAAQAGLEFCNETGLERSLAIGYKSGEKWQSEGWWNIAPGQCKTTVQGDLKQRYYYYRATASGVEFEGEDYAFCTEPAAFTIIGDSNCAARGYDTADFRKIDTGKSATQFTLTLVEERSGEVDLPPHGGDQQEPVIGIQHSGLKQGANGEPFADLFVFQGCEIEDGSEYCAFHANGWKYYAYYGGATPDTFLESLYDMPQGAPVYVIGDILSYGDITTEVTLSSVEYAPNADPHRALRDQLQGPWVSMDDPAYQTEVFGAESWEFHNGEFSGHMFLRLADSCDGAPQGAGPVLIQTEPETQESYCYGVQSISANRLDLAYFGSGSLLRFRRP